MEKLTKDGTTVEEYPMTIDLKRTIVTQFKEGRSVRAIFLDLVPHFHEFEIEQVVRDYVNGKFRLTQKVK